MTISIRNMGTDWIVACMIPKGNLMASIIRKSDEIGSFKLMKFECEVKITTAKENKKVEDDFKAFFEKGISSLVRDGKTCFVTNY